MLSDRVSRVLAAAVDGQLTPREQKAVDRLLRENAEAQQLYNALKGDSARLKRLPRHNLPEQVAGDLLRSVCNQPKPLPRAVGQVAQKYLPLWAILAAAAAVMLAISLGTYLIAVSTQQEQKQSVNQLAITKHPRVDHAESPVTIVSRPTSTPIASNNKKSALEVESLPPPRDEILAVDPPVELPDTVEPTNDAVLTVPFNPKIELFTVGMPKLPRILSVRQLDHLRANVLADSMNGQDALHVDLFTKDANKSFALLHQVLSQQGKKLFVEALASQRSQLKLKTNYVFYSESMTIEEIAKLLEAFAVEEKKADLRKDMQSEKLVSMPLSTTSQRTMALLLGVDPKNFLPKSKRPAALDIQKPIAEDTANSLAKALAEKEKPGARRVEPNFIAMSFNPVRPNPAFSKEIREFLATRKDRRPGSVPVMIVVRNLD